VGIKASACAHNRHCIALIRTVGFLQKLSRTDEVTKYRSIPVSRYFFRRYIIVGNFLTPRISTVERGAGGIFSGTHKIKLHRIITAVKLLLPVNIRA